MSDMPVSAAPSPRDPIDMRAVLARIDRDLAENIKRLAESRQCNRERWILPLTAFITVFGGILAVVIARLPEIQRAVGVAS